MLKKKVNSVEHRVKTCILNVCPVDVSCHYIYVMELTTAVMQVMGM